MPSALLALLAKQWVALSMRLEVRVFLHERMKEVHKPVFTMLPLADMRTLDFEQRGSILRICGGKVKSEEGAGRAGRCGSTPAT